MRRASTQTFTSRPSRARARVHLFLVAALGTAGLGAWASACGSTPAVTSSFMMDAGVDVRLGSMDVHTIRMPEASSLGDSSLPQPLSLEIVPPSATLTVRGTTPVKTSFTLVGKLPGGGRQEVVPDSVEFDRPDLATVVGPGSIAGSIVATAPVGSTPYGGTGKIHAVYKGLTATATLTVKVAVTSYGPGLSPTSPSVVALGGGGKDAGPKDAGSLPTDPAASILYPYDATVWPLGLTSPRLMWTAPAGGDVYRIHYDEAAFTYDGYFTLAALPGQDRLDQATWDHLTASNDAKTAPDPLTFTLSRYDSATKHAYQTARETWTVAPESLAGAIYYWSASENAAGVRVGHVSRFRPGTGATPEALYNGECVGCHAVNARGTVLVGDVDDTGITSDAGAAPTEPPYTNGFLTTRAWAAFDITKESAPRTEQTTEYGADLAVTPDGKYVVFGGKSVPTTPGSKFISLADLSGNVVVDSGLDQLDIPATDGGVNPLSPMMPAFSPDGTKLALVVAPTWHDSAQDNVLPEIPSPNPQGLTESIATLSFDESGPRFDPTLDTLFDSSNAAFATVGPGGTAWNGLAYPSFTPDSKAIAFHVGQYATGCNSFNAGSTDPSVSCGDFGQDNGALFIATLAAKKPIRMAHADTPPVAADAYSSVEPTFNPVVRGGYSWVVFTSLRQWGNQPWPGEVTEAGAAGAGLINAKRRLWVAAVDTSLGTVDPSHPAIFLEGQDDTPNMRGFWTLASCIETPGASSDGADAGAPADGGNAKDASAASSLACTNGFQCCSGFCEHGVCVDVGVVACAAAGASCKATKDCCNSTVVECQSGTCVAEIPR